MPVRGMIVEDQAGFRRLLAAMLDRQDGLEVVAEAESVQTARELTCRAALDVVLLDLNLPDGKGWDLIADLREANPGVGVLVLSASFCTRGGLRMSAYVLIGGGWLGGWCWQPVARRLRQEGHDAYPVTLTGLGERVHLASAEVDLETHVTDVVNLVEYEGLNGVVLVGHSYGGLVATGAADRIPERVSLLAYLDIAPLPDGGALIDKFPPGLRERAERQVEEMGDGWRLPIPPWEELAEMASFEGLDEDHLRLLHSRATPQPFRTYTQPLRLGNPAREALPKLGIACSFSPDRMRQMVAGVRPTAGVPSVANWRFVGLPTGHYPMLSRPAGLAEVLLGLATSATDGGTNPREG